MPTEIKPEYFPNIRIMLEHVVEDEDELPHNEEPEEGLDYFCVGLVQYTVCGSGYVNVWEYVGEDGESTGEEYGDWSYSDVEWDDIDVMESERTASHTKLLDMKGDPFSKELWRAEKVSGGIRRLVDEYGVRIPPWYWALDEHQTKIDEWITGVRENG